MKKQLGNYLVLFRPGVITGMHSEREVVLKDICERLGGFDCKVFDPYFAYSDFCDAGLLVRVEQGNIYGFYSVAFFYVDRKSEHEIRRKIINGILDSVKSNSKLFENGYVIVSDRQGNLKLNYIKDRVCI